MALVDLRLTKKERQEEVAEVMSPADMEPEYPYGLCLRLDTDELDKLGVTTLPDAGTEIHIVAIGKVVRVSESASEDNRECGLEIQITQMELTPEAADPGEDYEGARAEKAESQAVGGANTVMSNGYRGRR